MSQLPGGYTSRPAGVSDAESLASLANAYGRRMTGDDIISADRLAAQMTTPGFRVSEDSRLVLDDTGQLVAAGMVMDFAEPHVRINAWGIVDPAHQGQGIGSFLHEWIVQRARQALEKAPPDARVVVEQSMFDGDDTATAFLEAHGWVPTRHYWRMAIDLEGPIEAPGWPDGIVPKAVDVDTELEASVRAVDEAFRDHYGFVEGSFEEHLERTRHRIETDPDYDPELNFVARDGDQIAGVCFCQPRSGTNDDAGYVGALGVLRPWRQRGLGLALLLEAFQRFRAKGKRRAHLHVDAESLTGATRLYKRAGMHVDQLSHEYTLELRPGVDLATR